MSNDLQAIRDVHDKISDKVSLDEFREKIGEKVKEHYGLLSEVGAAKLVAREMGATFEAPQVSFKIKNLAPGMSSVDVVGRVVMIYDVRTFDSQSGSGKVGNMRIMDETGDVRVVMWGEKTAVIERSEVNRGDVVEIRNGYTRTGLSGDIEVHVGRRGRVVSNPAISEPMPELEENEVKVKDVKEGMRDVSIQGVVSGVSNVRTFSRPDGRNGRVASLFLRDDTGEIRVSLWNEKTDDIDRIKKGNAIKIAGAYTKEGFNDSVEIHCSSSARMEVQEETEDLPEIESEPMPLEKLEDSMQSVDVEGKVTRNFGKRTFARLNGGEGKVANLMISDGTAETRLVLWGDSADLVENLVEGSRVRVENGYTKTGMDQGLELHVGWRGRVMAKVEEFKPMACDLQAGMHDIDLKLAVVEVGLPEEFEDAKLVSTVLGDATARRTAVFWDNHVETLKDLGPGTGIEVKGIKVNDLGEIQVQPESSVEVIEDEVPVIPADGPRDVLVSELRAGEPAAVRGALVALTHIRVTSSFGPDVLICSLLVDDGSGQVQIKAVGEECMKLFEQGQGRSTQDLRERFLRGHEFKFKGVLIGDWFRVDQISVPDLRQEVVALMEEVTGDE
jgi:replication factor A1